MNNAELQVFRQTTLHKIENSFNDLQDSYSRFDNTPVLPENKPYSIHKNSSSCIYLLHGFIGTPYEMSPFVNLAKNHNFDVINDLIPGHGASAHIANQFKQEIWTEHVGKHLDLLRSAYTKIHVIGFSTGALLLHQYQRLNPNWQPASVSYCSPYFTSYFKSARWLQKTAKIFTNKINIQFAYDWTKYQDIRVAYLDKIHYMQDLPLDTAEQIYLMGRSEYNLKSTFNTKTPTRVFLTACDQVLNFTDSEKLIHTCYTNSEVSLFARKDKVPHHLMVPSVSKYADKIFTETIEFILKKDSEVI